MMIYYDHRMIEGSPLHYHPYAYSTSPATTGYSYFRRFELEPKMSEELLIPNSPSSMQSDSDNSISSIDISPEPIMRTPVPTTSTKGVETKCRWRSCGIVFESLDKLSDHVSKVHAISGLGGLYYCGWDGCARNNKGFNARYKMLVHVRTHTNEKPHQCNLCSKSFSRAENLKIHTRSHSGEKPYICPVPGCNKAYSNSSDRFKHTRTHQVEKPYQCKVPGCPKRYTDPSSLRKHVKTYKHFVNENNQLNITHVESITDHRLVPDIDKTANDVMTPHIEEVSYAINVNKAPEAHFQSNSPRGCNCTHSCYLSKCLGINSLINIQEKEVRPWNSFIDSYFTDSKRIYSYDLRENHMDVDLPLDLSMRRKHI